MPPAPPGGALALADDLVLSRMGYGAMRLAGPGVLGPPKDRDEAIAVQNRYNLTDRQDDELVDRCEREGIAFAPYFPLGGSPSLSLGVLDRVAARLNTSPQQAALAWLLQRSSTMTVIPGTSSVAHLRENIAAAGLVLPADAIAELGAISPARSG
jgi:aryl-alcohol dehydrogenase-like predicted oxidoreductase